jgi:CyaY protein
MTETEFQREVALVLERVETALDEVGADIDCERKADTVLDLGFPDGSHVIVNGQAAAREIWLAAKSGGQHFRFQEGMWVNTRDGTELFRVLSSVVSQQCGLGVILRRQEV